MKTLLTWIFILSSTILTAQTSPELQQIDSILNNIWNHKKAAYVHSLKNHKSGSNTKLLYNIQVYTNNLLRYAHNQKKYSILNDLAEVYLAAYDKLSYLHTKKVSSYCSIEFSEPQLAWTTGDHTETALNSTQFLYVIAKAVNYAISIPSDTLNEYKELDRLISKYVPVLEAHYNRWLTVDATWQVDGWRYCISGCFTHQEFLALKLQQQLEKTNHGKTYCNVVTDIDMWIIAGITELLAANDKNPTRVPLDADLKVLFQGHVDLGTKLIASRLTSTTLTDFKGNQVNGLVFEPGGYSYHADYQYAGITKLDCLPASTGVVPDAGWDISHARRLVQVFESLYEHRDVTGQSFPNMSTMQGLANQFLYGVFNQDFNYPLFSNYYDGTDGWYRVNYSAKVAGYKPSDLSILAITGGYCFWSKYNPDFIQLRYTLWNMMTSTNKKVISHIANHYGTYYAPGCTQVENRNFDHSDAFSTSTDLLQFLPTFFPYF